MSSDRSTSNSSLHTPQNEDQLKQKRKRTTYTIVGVIIALIASTLVESYFLQAEANTSIANNILILAVFNIIIILLFVLIVLIIRNLVKVYNERKSKIIGSKFQTKLIIAFLILALVPSILLFTVASKLFSFSIGNWFNLRTEQTLQYSMDIARDYYSEFENRALLKTKNIENFIKDNNLYLKTNREKLYTFVRNKTSEYNLAGIIIYDDNLKEIASSIDSLVIPDTKNLNHAKLIQKSTDGERFTEIQIIQGKNVMVVVAPLTEIINENLMIWGYILTLTPAYKNSLGKVEAIKITYQDYKQQKYLQLPVSANYHITFLLITLLILFSAIWLGFYMARGITVPIQQLAEGTRRITEGDLTFRIGVRATDEIALLVDSFNTMTKELNESRIDIQQVNQNLKQTNIELDRRRNYIETILDNIGAGVISIDKKGRITTFNKAAENILQSQDQNIFGSNYKDAFDHSYHEPIRKLIQKMNIQNQNSIEEQMELRVKGTNINLLINIQVLTGVSQKYRGMVIVFEDLTQLIKAQKIAAWKEV
ncbi:MAG: HAMP domain-containing protein, partial [Nitrospinota bacterium]|nr:HAMP domain-containing protein [Nitrospinota bacterium]